MQMNPAGNIGLGAPRLVKQFENTPLTQSVVDQIIFNRDMDFSGNDQFDDSFVNLYTGSAGKASWHPPPLGKAVWDPSYIPGMPTVTADRRDRGRRTYGNNPTQQSLVDQTVFNRDVDASGDSAFDESFMAMYNNSAGCPSWVSAPRGLKQPEPIQELPVQKQPVEFLSAKQKQLRARKQRARQHAAPADQLPPLPQGLPQQLEASDVQGSARGQGRGRKMAAVAQCVSGKVAQQVSSMAALVDKWKARRPTSQVSRRDAGWK